MQRAAPHRPHAAHTDHPQHLTPHPIAPPIAPAPLSKPLALLCALALASLPLALSGCDDEAPPTGEPAGGGAGAGGDGPLAGAPAGGGAGISAGTGAGISAGTGAGISAGASAGVSAGVSAGASAGVSAGVSAGASAGVSAGASAGGASAGSEAPPPSNEDITLDALTPADLAAIDAAPVATDCQPITFVYPEAGVVIPSNLFGLTFQWRDSIGGPYLITATAGRYRVRWLTTQRALTPEGTPWELLKRNSAGGAITWGVSVLREGARCDGPTQPVIVDPSELLGAVYYWSTGDMGIMRLAAGERAPEPFLNPSTAPELNCPACHALSRDGRRVAFTRTSFPPFGDLATSLVEQPRQLLFNPTGVEGYFPSFSPNPTYLVAGSSGQLLIRNSDTGERLNSLPLPMSTVAGSPDWSWQGDKITAAVGPVGLVNLVPNAAISLGALYEWTRAGGGTDVGSQPSDWGTPRLVVPQEGDMSNDRPAYSPNGAYIAFNRKGDDPGAGEGMGNANVDLWIVRADQPSAPPTQMSRANRAQMLGNSWPKWAPSDRRGRLWLAFSSFRDYGDVLPTNAAVDRRPQIWVTAVDPDAPAGVDPSAPAFWLPFQSPESGNHIPYWAAYEKR
jgi:hypothetical protein